jgi:NADH-quinone oxidoreductase subunit K
MFILQLLTNAVLFLIGIFGIILNKGSILLILMCIELILLSVNLNFITFSIYLDDFIGQIFALFILTIAAAESAIGLAILILYYRVRGTISINNTSVLKG